MPATREQIAAAKTLSQLQTLERKHGYSFGWANKVHAARARNKNRKQSGEVGKETENKNEVQRERRVAGPLVLSSHWSSIDN